MERIKNPAKALQPALFPIAKKLHLLAHEKLHTGYWKNVPKVWRDVYVFATLYLAVTIEIPDVDWFKEVIRLFDMAILLGRGKYHSMLQEYIELASGVYRELYGDTDVVEGDFGENEDEVEVTHEVTSVERMGIIEFMLFVGYCFVNFRSYFKLKRPVLIRNVATHWPATTKWSLTYLNVKQ